MNAGLRSSSKTSETLLSALWRNGDDDTTCAIGIEIPVVVHAAGHTAYSGKVLPPLHEKTQTAIVFPRGGVVRLAADLSVGELVVLTNQQSGADVLCRVNSVKVLGSQNYVGLEFTQRATSFWDQCFVAEPSTQTESPLHESALPIVATVQGITGPVQQPDVRSSFDAGYHPATGGQQVWGKQSSPILTLFPGPLISRPSTLGMANDSLTQRKKEMSRDDRRRPGAVPTSIDSRVPKNNFRIVAFVGLCLLGSLLPFMGRPKPAQATSSAGNLLKAAMPTYSADPLDTRSGQLLTVVARSGQTLEDLSLLYGGDFDRNLFEEICRLNPQMKDPSHLEAGQLIRIPLPPGTLRKAMVRAEATSTPNP